jgi:translation initiation factor 4E
MKVVSVKKRGNRIQLWTRNKSEIESLNQLGKRMMKILEMEDEPGIQFDFQVSLYNIKSLVLFTIF